MTPKRNLKMMIFQSTLPLRGATIALCRRRNTHLFQSTLPLRGATQSLQVHECRKLNFNPHSPCGERLKHVAVQLPCYVFQSTLPLRGATGVRCTQSECRSISIHTPLAGSDRVCGNSELNVIISIHTPLAGSDSAKSNEGSCFGKFQSTLPLRGATRHAALPRQLRRISIHTPLAGSDPSRASCASESENFNPHSPCGERL